MENKDSFESEEREFQRQEKLSGEAASGKEQDATASDSKISNDETRAKTNIGGRKRTRTRITQATDRKSCILVSTDEDKHGSASIISRNNDATRVAAQPKETNNDEDWDISLEGMFAKLSREADEVIGRTMQMLEQEEPVRTSSHRPPHHVRERNSSQAGGRADNRPIYPFERQKKRHSAEPLEEKTAHDAQASSKGKKKKKKKIQRRPEEVISYPEMPVDPKTPLRLNKFLASSGVCSRRVADQLIVEGHVSVNGEVVTQLGKHVTREDFISVDGKPVSIEKKIYVLLNKPRNCVTTSSDPEKRLTAIDLVRNACSERIYPVGRLDRNTTGLLLLTNDGDLAAKLMHPKYEKKKIYQVTLDKPVSVEHMQQIASGIELEDGEIHADAISYVDENNLAIVGIEIHSGRNRIVRRIFKHLGYRVYKLDRVYFAGLTKRDLPRGRWRYLTEDEVRNLRHDFYE
ncbi:pseudouridine synthase [uncultured Porphyromonas sp.]|uniref:pseudouridine synthase n=1 Tax=uncultured Porphyromonas sp. TaxID=159274 RepID=UPI002638A833|nr:pseudouridine synthase [uncultured Porphyromonas sp.]